MAPRTIRQNHLLHFTMVSQIGEPLPQGPTHRDLAPGRADGRLGSEVQDAVNAGWSPRQSAAKLESGRRSRRRIGHEHADHRREEAGHRDAQRSLRIVLGLSVVYLIAEAVGGWLANSLALLADAGHMLS